MVSSIAGNSFAARNAQPDDAQARSSATADAARFGRPMPAVSLRDFYEAMEGVFFEMGVNPGDALEKLISKFADAASSITELAYPVRIDSSEKMLDVASEMTGKTVTAVHNLRADDGTKVDSLRLNNGKIKVDTSLSSMKLAKVLINALVEHVYEKTFRGDNLSEFVELFWEDAHHINKPDY